MEVLMEKLPSVRDLEDKTVAVRPSLHGSARRCDDRNAGGGAAIEGVFLYGDIRRSKDDFFQVHAIRKSLAADGLQPEASGEIQFFDDSAGKGFILYCGQI